VFERNTRILRRKPPVDPDLLSVSLGFSGRHLLPEQGFLSDPLTRHCLLKTAGSISAIFSQLPGLGV